MTAIRFDVLINVVDQTKLAKGTEALGYDVEPDDVLEMLELTVTNADKAPLDTGFEITEKRVVGHDAEHQFTLTVWLTVNDEAAFIAEAKTRYNECWGDDDWTPDTLGEAAYEILVGSNAGETPDVLGFEIMNVTYPADHQLNNAGAPRL